MYTDKYPNMKHIYAIIDSLITNKYYVGLFIDLKKSFDTVNHEILLKCLHFTV